jgi:hypothetical protein
MAHEVLEQGEFLRRQLDQRLSPADGPRRRVQRQPGRLQPRGTLARPPPQQRADPCGQLGEGERLGQVVVRADIQPADTVIDVITDREHEHRHPPAPLPELPAQLEAVHARQHDIQDDDVVGVLDGHPQAVLPGPGDVNRVAFLLQATLEQPRIFAESSTTNTLIAYPGLRR